jgi:cytochrome P450
MQPYTDRFKAYRKLLKPYFGSERIVRQYTPLQEVEVHRFLWRVLKDQKGLTQHIQTSVILSILL